MYSISALLPEQQLEVGDQLQVAGFPYIDKGEHTQWLYCDPEVMAAPVSKLIADQRIHLMGVITAGASGSAAYLQEEDVNGQSSVIPYGLLSKLLTVSHGKSDVRARCRH